MIYELRHTDLPAIILETPDLDRVWETYVQIPHDNSDSTYVQVMRKQLAPLIHDLKEQGIIGWYCILVHDRHSGVPTTADDDNPYWHIRFTLKEGVDPSSLQKLLPACCIMTRKADVQRLWAINQELLKDCDIRQAWRIIGEQSEWFLDMLDIHREDADIYPRQIVQFLHHFWNLAKLRHGWEYKGQWDMPCKSCGQRFLVTGPLCPKCATSS